MPWCTKCKTEYRDGFVICSECGSQLEEGSIPEEECNSEVEDTDTTNEPALLMQVSNEYEAENIKALLAGEGIPAYASHRGAGQYLSIYMGLSNMGMKIFVPKSALEQAERIIQDASEHEAEVIIDDDDTLPIDNDEEGEALDNGELNVDNSDNANNSDSEDTSYIGRRKTTARILIIPWLIVLVFLLYGIISFLFR